MAGTKLEQVHADLLPCLKPEMCFAVHRRYCGRMEKGGDVSYSWLENVGYQNFLLWILSKGK